MATTSTTTTTPTTAKKNLGWLWYFLILTVLAVTATTVLVVYNLMLQLKPERLEEARQTWKENRPSSYLLKYTIQNIDNDADEYQVTVKNNEVTSAMYNGRAEPANRLHWYGMEKLFSYIDTNLELDKKKGQPRSYQRAVFDPDTGALRWYVRRVMGTRERVEIVVKPLEDVK